MKYNLNIVLQYFKSVGLPKPEVEQRFCPNRKWRFDFAWVGQRLALEVEGGVWVKGRHTRGSGFVKDMEKYNEAARMGWRIIRVMPENLCMNDTVKLIADCLKL